MKNKFLLACIVGLLSASTIYARPATETEYTSVIRDFIDSHMTSNFKKLKSIMSDNSVLKIPRGEKVLVQEKDDLVSMMKKDAGTTQNCASSYEVLAKSDAMVIARVDFNYENCSQHDYLIIEKNDKQDWKITQVCKMFEDIKTPLTNDNSVVAKN
ncbi:Putative lumazine-binding [Mucilaginibacter gossypiicola]|uniref:Putative lumazine-binding n=1 Tax=Mucilaginibacter gossypiicola TaxID=551995 RepID=A0A1H8J5K6_9SPHI|nr:nuclear transport factor 2 family protein [Mucilaginibacter gossypiicola]SEN75959.1 Putative lumazine-binding [Mucilaginibacter gossypiicola]